MLIVGIGHPVVRDDPVQELPGLEKIQENKEAQGRARQQAA